MSEQVNVGDKVRIVDWSWAMGVFDDGYKRAWRDGCGHDRVYTVIQSGGDLPTEVCHYNRYGPNNLTLRSCDGKLIVFSRQDFVRVVEKAAPTITQEFAGRFARLMEDFCRKAVEQAASETNAGSK